MSERNERAGKEDRVDETRPKPTRENATASPDPIDFLSRDQRGSAGAGTGPEYARGSGRTDPTAADDSRPRRPHLTQNDEDAPLQDGVVNPDDVPALPANASGKDLIDPAEMPTEVREESMYSERPSVDKDHPPSDDAR